MEVGAQVNLDSRRFGGHDSQVISTDSVIFFVTVPIPRLSLSRGGGAASSRGIWAQTGMRSEIDFLSSTVTVIDLHKKDVVLGSS